MAIDPKTLQGLLKYAVQSNASDIHFRSGAAPAFRIKGDLVNVKLAPFTDEDMVELAKMMIDDPQINAQLDQITDFDGSFDLPGICRYRFNIFRHGGALGAVLRVIPMKIPTIAELGLSTVLQRIADYDRGLVLVTGATGSGKSSTLAAMIDYINSKRACHIVTIEDPIEFVHPQRKARITQREVGRDTESFSGALRAALRQDPDIILVGEMRDAETIDIALKAAETGHIVFSTVHTTDAAKTINRLISIFPAEEQQQVRLRLADCLRGTISQRLLPRKDGRGRVVAQEIMVVNKAIQECIIDSTRAHEINDFIVNGHEILGSQTFDQHVVKLYKSGVIALEIAKEASSNAADFQRNLQFSSDNSGQKTGINTSMMRQRGTGVENEGQQVVLDVGSKVAEKKPA